MAGNPSANIMNYGDAGLSPRTVLYAERQMLDYAEPVMVLQKMAKPMTMPKNKTQTISFRRPVPFPAKTTPLVEGITPGSTPLTFDDVTTTLQQYGDWSEITDVIADTHEDPVLQEATTQHGDNIGRTTEALTWGTCIAGTNVFYGNGVARGDVNTPITKAKQRAITRALKAQNGKKITRILNPSEANNTSPVEAAYVAVAHTDCESDIRDMPGFVPTAEYGRRSVICDEEIGSVEDVRYVLSPDLDPILTSGNATANGMVATAGQVDVYPVLFLAQNAFATVVLKNMGDVKLMTVPVGKPTSSDPLGQRGSVGWKTWFTSVILNDAWMARLEVGVTAL